MDHKRRRFRPSPDSLEARVALHMGGHSIDTQAEINTPSLVTQAEVNRLPAVTQHVLAMGSLSGRYLATGQDNRPADQPLQVGVNAVGRVQGLGHVTVTGSLQFGGFLLPGRPDVSGTVTLSNARGSVTVALTGTGGSGPIPNRRFRLDALVIGGTGAYADLTEVGTATALFGRNAVRSGTTPDPLGGPLKLQMNFKSPVR